MNESRESPAARICERWADSALAGKLGPAILLLGKLVRRRIETALADAGLGLTPAQARIIVMLHLHGPMSQQGLASLTDVEPSTLVRTLDVMEREGLASREPNPEDRRAYLVRLTDHGADQVPKLYALWDGVEQALTSGMEATERDELLAALEELIGRLAAADIEKLERGAEK